MKISVLKLFPAELSIQVAGKEPTHGQINYFLDIKAKCHLKITCKGTLRQATICLIPLPLPLHTEYGTNMYLFTQGRGRGGGEFNQREV
jgi:hypothetical protein